MEIEFKAQHYAIIFIRAENKLIAANDIIALINDLKFTDGTQLTNENREFIVQLIGEFVSNKRIFKYKYGGYVVAPKAYDNEAFLELVDYILSQVKR